MWFENEYKASKLLITALIMSLSLFIFTGCNNKRHEGEEKISIKDTVYTSAVMEKNNNIYLYHQEYDYLEPVGELSRLKELTVLSEDMKNIAFKYIDEPNKVNIYNLQSREYTSLEVDEVGEISDIQWFGDLLAIGIYENPTTNKYLIYDSKSLQLINSCRGILIDVLDEGKTLIYGVNIQGVTSIYINDNNIYTMKKNGEILLGGRISPDKKEISFITFVFDREKFQQQEFLYRGKLENGNISKVKVLEKPYEIYGKLQYDGNKLIILNSDNYTELINEEFITNTLSDINVSIKENTKKLKDILKKTFKSEIIDIDMTWEEVGIKNITWFNR